MYKTHCEPTYLLFHIQFGQHWNVENWNEGRVGYWNDGINYQAFYFRATLFECSCERSGILKL